ncbi:pantoate--beta-alanine ligase [Porphyromonas sp. COT-290 OH3588]|uniref:pantoate--beta-alanine ligase n=1 Tax=Porphyromonas sp. COT-290 OH3588 TaxID=1515617 RepID=UPI00052CCE66|nr:pantoate--beta-alanine ligase [Porphyromonas sp. COT-290 OH3588]KGO01115.1 pantoate--beta-alanine ligase [Porphyromonas sp. COT-290 OH3588]
MKVFNSAAELQAYITTERTAGRTVGFVPTMGALHAGHISLVKRALQECDRCVVSVFVNPTQFNDPKDLATYPRTFEADALLLAEAGADAVFHPSVEEVYPERDERIFEVGRVAEVMEGAHRPGHFNGVMQVVSRLFDIVRPDKAFFGDKDFQQIAVVRAMVRLIGSPVQIVDCPIVREADGLALSSRNVRLTPEQRSIAPNIYRTLRESLDFAKEHTPKETELWVINQLNAIEQLRVEYYEIVDADSLERVESWQDSLRIQGCITVFCGEVRLIDNIAYK